MTGQVTSSLVLPLILWWWRWCGDGDGMLSKKLFCLAVKLMAKLLIPTHVDGVDWNLCVSLLSVIDRACTNDAQNALF